MPEEPVKEEPIKEKGITRDLAYTVRYIVPIVACIVGLLGFLEKRSQDRQASLNKQFDEVKQEIKDLRSDADKRYGQMDRRVTYLEYKVQLIDQGLSGVEIKMPSISKMQRMFNKLDSVPMYAPTPAPPPGP